MEIKFLNISLKNKNKYVIKNLNLSIKHSLITGVYQDNLKIIPNLLTQNINYLKGNILIDNVSFYAYEDNLISYIDNNFNFLTRSVSDEFFLASHKINNPKNEEYLNKIISSLKLFDLSEIFLERNINTLSKSEKKLVKILTNLIIDPDILIFDEPFLYFDKDNREKFKKVILELKRKYNKTIIILSDDINILYEISDELIVFKENQVLIADKVKNIFKNLVFLENNSIPLPNLILFNKIALNYKQKLTSHKDVKDLIKEVYRNVTEFKKEV